MERNLSEKVFEKIKNEKIEPKPKWEFLLKDSFLWGVFMISVVFGAIGFSVFLFLLIENNWSFYIESGKSFLEYFFLTMPYFWFFTSIILIFVVFYNFRHTKNGYKFEPIKIIFSSILVSVIFGLFFYKIGFAEKLDQIFYHKVPFYNNIMEHRNMVWSNPEDGYIMGKILNLNVEKRNFNLKDPNGKIWIVDFRDAEIRGRIELRNGENVRIIGKKVSDKNFYADSIRPLYRRKGMGIQKGVHENSDIYRFLNP
ncbi:MAG: hypothetical protein Fur0024_2500 [Patescibacteria group bacterium]